jgi:hypothetical protein
MREEFKIIKANDCAKTLCAYMYRYKCRMHFYRMYLTKRLHYAATTLQRIHRGIVGRARGAKQRAYMNHFRANTPSAKMIQAAFRGHKVRRIRFDVALALREMYIARKLEAEVALAVRFQAGGRKYLTKQRVRAILELMTRRKLDEHNAIITLQCFARMFVSKVRLAKKFTDRDRYHEIRNSAATRIQHFQKAIMGQHKARQSRGEAQIVARRREVAARKCQNVYRGHLGRQRVRRKRIRIAEKWWCAAQIQRIWRGSRIMNWRDMRINTIAAYVLDRQYLERRERIRDARFRYKRFIEETRKDSASDQDDAQHDNEKITWEERFDVLSNRKYWFSKHLNQATYDEPLTELAMEQALLHRRVKVFWVVQNVWYDGTIVRFNKRKHRHKVSYDDGDTEWIDFDEEKDRVQIQEDDGSWVMYIMYHPNIMFGEHKKLEEKGKRTKFKQQATVDANQWEPIEDGHGGEAIMYISTKSGVIRTGTEGCRDWMVQDDGHGFPCFYNLKTQEIVYEDPRFESSESSDLKGQRDYVMGELRYASYFCKELLERYDATFKKPVVSKKGKQKEEPVNKQTEGGRQSRFMANMIRKSDKPRHLAAFLLRAKALYAPESLVDAPHDPNALKEIDYADWMTVRFHKIIEHASHEGREVRDKRLDIVLKLRAKGEKKVFCPSCFRETRRHLDFCPTCGVKSNNLIVEGDPNDPTLRLTDGAGSASGSGRDDEDSLHSVGGGGGGGGEFDFGSDDEGANDGDDSDQGEREGEDRSDSSPRTNQVGGATATTDSNTGIRDITPAGNGSVMVTLSGSVDGGSLSGEVDEDGEDPDEDSSAPGAKTKGVRWATQLERKQELSVGGSVSISQGSLDDDGLDGDGDEASLGDGSLGDGDGDADEDGDEDEDD